MQGSYRLEYAVVRSVHGRLKLGKPEQPTKNQRNNVTENEPSGREHRKPPTPQHRQRGGRHSRGQQYPRGQHSEQNVRGVDLLEHLVDDKEVDENDYEKPFF